MDLPRVEITQTFARTGMTHRRPPMSITQRPADMQINQELVGTLRISTTASELFIDQSQAFADADLKGPLQRGTEFAARARQNVLQYISKTMQEAEQLKKIENGTDAIPLLAKQNGERAPKQYNYAQVPSGTEKVKFDYRPSEVSVHIDWPDPDIRVQRHEPEIHIPRWETDIYLQQKNTISFSVTGGYIDTHL